jgi:hypothetical protein
MSGGQVLKRPLILRGFDRNLTLLQNNFILGSTLRARTTAFSSAASRLISHGLAFSCPTPRRTKAKSHKSTGASRSPAFPVLNGLADCTFLGVAHRETFRFPGTAKKENN